jgi:hypothetical protein
VAVPAGNGPTALIAVTTSCVRRRTFARELGPLAVARRYSEILIVVARRPERKSAKRTARRGRFGDNAGCLLDE